ncbi:DsbA family protein [Tabrizicola piscis]|uniref:DsbA family protein n=1 Tax=Tabrizicola piscis TaxID=2494374 RepID=A0A3S8U7B2_9RHOB|nr:DsbA family protein [Tabrizicola piscis]AZL59494.1 DsbA family protein [Tabrizicola piscis]
MLKLNRRAMIALAAAMAASPVVAQEAAADLTDYSMGSPDAPVKIVEYASFTCPHCATFHATVFKDLKRDYIDTGKVHFTLREVYFDRYGLWAAMVARCGGEMRYFGIHDMLFDQQAEWAASQDPMVVVQNLKTIGIAAGLDGAAIDACLNDQATAEALIARFQVNMEADGVQGTPTIIINGEKHSNMAYADLKAIIDAELAG